MNRAALLTALLPLSACVATAEAPSAPPLPAPQQAFWDALESHCGNAYAGSLATEDARDEAFRGKRMLAHWAECTPARIAIAFHIEDADKAGGWDRSRTWLVSRTAEGLRLKHDHRHADGSVDAVTQYGGDTSDQGTPGAQDFPVDPYSIALFEREGLDLSLTNVWRVEVDPAGEPDARFAYQLTRRNDPTRLFRVAFDAARPVAAPPPAWGW
ncbi:hypothetical protein [Erythrobacter sp. A6_0]|uniref:hypothetical protein n=1 Tax=Erythrobacter sp. A6_0 TaxID=2821089 RepID=UPI001ADA0F4A|nr:hypothetical protein [Erythrobacter sp. A6_0]MBO9511665.1 hypothetical protein [Erythrobacter sp. A6_0]